jgi:Na+-driven multidrug efflux pump
MAGSFSSFHTILPMLLSHKVKRIYQGIGQACLISTGISALMALLNGMFGRQIANLFLGEEETAATMVYAL